MGYELYIYPANASQKLTIDQIIAEFSKVRIKGVPHSDESESWIDLEGNESTLNLTTQNQLVTGAGMRFVSTDDPELIDKVVEVFQQQGWIVSDDKGEL